MNNLERNERPTWDPLHTCVSIDFTPLTYHPSPEIGRGDELVLPSFSFSFRYSIPHCSGENHILQRLLTAKFLEHEKIFLCGTLHPNVTDSVKVYDTTEPDLVVV